MRLFIIMTIQPITRNGRWRLDEVRVHIQDIDIDINYIKVYKVEAGTHRGNGYVGTKCCQRARIYISCANRKEFSRTIYCN